MPWKQRGSRRYWYRSVRVGGRVVSEYVAGGEVGGAIAFFDQRDSLRARLARAELRGALGGIDAAARAVRESAEATDAAVALALAARGYHRPKRGPWRKKREPERRQSQQEGDDPMAGTLGGEMKFIDGTKQDALAREAGALVPADRGARKDLILRGMRKDSTPKQVAAAVACLRAHPLEVGTFWGSVTETTTNRLCEGRPAFQQMLRNDADLLVRDLVGADPPPIERALAEQAAAATLHLSMVEHQYAAWRGGAESRPLDSLEQFERRVERGHRMLTAALLALARVRKLNLPAPPNVQINIAAAGGQQVNRQVNAASPGGEHSVPGAA